MRSICIVSPGGEKVNGLQSELSWLGFGCSIASDGEDLDRQVAELRPDLVLMVMNGRLAPIQELASKIKSERHLPVVALVGREVLDSSDLTPHIDDFVVKPADAKEIALRARRLLQKGGKSDADEVIKCGDLIIDQASCQVTVAGVLVALTFKEYELLKFLATNRGRVFSRQTLLDRVWGYDYFGGDRTVDVHVRRLRSKIESGSRAFIETVRNIGYRFQEGT